MHALWDGFYTAYMSGRDGQGFAIFVLYNGIISGADPLGVNFDGTYEVLQDASLNGRLFVSIPPGSTVIQGVFSGSSGMQYDFPIVFAPNALSLDYLELQTPLGPVNMRIKKLREIGQMDMSLSS